jgi:hypothetical protein
MHRVARPALNVGDEAPGVSLVPGPVQCFSGDAELDDEIFAEILRLALARFSRQRRSNAASSALMIIRASEPPMNKRRSTLALFELRVIRFSFEFTTPSSPRGDK